MSVLESHKCLYACSWHLLLMYSASMDFAARRLLSVLDVLFCTVQEQRMHGAVLLINYCSKCSADLWLSAVISSAAPGQAVCPEHAAALPAPPDSCTLLFRHSIEELQRLLFEAAALFPGCADDVRAAQQRVRTRPTIRGLKSLGPLVQLAQKMLAPRAPELKPGGREPHTPIAGERVVGSDEV
jgi:hypothetical protein